MAWSIQCGCVRLVVIQDVTYVVIHDGIHVVIHVVRIDSVLLLILYIACLSYRNIANIHDCILFEVLQLVIIVSGVLQIECM